ncbi:MAG: type III-A CRISPR-associated RAMP protein Csm3 [candidate division WOR-3 bacterium]
MKLNTFCQLTATLRLKSGLHIGSGEKAHYGEPVSVLKSLQTQLPYIPGSSIKGKMRHLLEITYNKTSNGEPCSCGKCQICQLFGSGKAATTFEPSRLIFRDCFLTEKSAAFIEKVDLEKKAGVRIDRKTGKAAEKALYSLERVPEGCEFNLQISVRVFEKDQLESVKQWLAMGLFLIEHDALGGSGTRGSGYIEFDNIKFDGQAFEKDWREKCQQNKDNFLNVKIKTE